MYNRDPLSGTVETLETAGLDYEFVPCLTEEALIKAGRDADAILIGTVPLTTRRAMEHMPRLKLVGRSGVGVDSVDLDAATEMGICVTNTPGINSSEVADHAMALLLSITRNIPELASAVSKGAWSDDPKQFGRMRKHLRRLAGFTVGIFGFGNIGRAFSQRIRGFGPGRIIATDPYIQQTSADLYGVELVDFDTLISESDIISIHSASTKENFHAFDASAFAKMKEGAILINCARGPIVDESALAQALNSDNLAAAGIDVTEVEPLDAESVLLNTKNLTITPHVAGSSNITVEEGAKRWAENPVNLFNGKPLHGLANPEVVKTIAVMRSNGSSKWDDLPDPVIGRGF